MTLIQWVVCGNEDKSTVYKRMWQKQVAFLDGFIGGNVSGKSLNNLSRGINTLMRLGEKVND